MKARKLLTAITALVMLLTFPGAALAAASQSLGNKIWITLDDTTGMPTSESNTVVQTEDGYIWVGCYSGLLRYDGREFKKYTVDAEDGILNQGVRSLFLDSRGRMLIGMNDAGIYIMEDGAFSACPCADGVPFGSVRGFAEAQDGTIYAATATGVAYIDEKGTHALGIPEIENTIIYSLGIDANGALWGTAADGSLFCIKDGELKYLIASGSVAPADNYSVLCTGDTIYVGTASDVQYRLTLNDANYTYASYSAETIPTPGCSGINKMLYDKEGVWLCADNGLGLIGEDGVFKKLGAPEDHAFICDMCIDYEGNYWMSSSKYGLFHLLSGKFYSYSREAGIDKKTVNAVLRSGGRCYIGADDGLYAATADWLPIENKFTEALAGVRIRALCPDSAGRIWAMTYADMGAVIYDPESDSIKTIGEKDGLASNRLRCARELSDGSMAIGSMGGVNIVKNDEVTASCGIEQGLPSSMILCLEELPDGTLAAGSDGSGIYLIKDGKVSVIEEESGLTDGVVLRMKAMEGGLLISAGQSLYFWENASAAGGAIRRLEHFTGGADSVFDIQTMDSGAYLMTGASVIKAEAAALVRDEAQECTVYGKESGLTGNIAANSWSWLEGGVLYIGTSCGICYLDLEDIPINRAEPIAAVNTVMTESAKGEICVYEAPESITIPADTRRMTVSFAALSYSRPGATLRYFLDGFDSSPHFIDPDDTPAVSYTNLPGGTYTFCLNAINADGVSARMELRVKIIKEKAFTETAWFYILLVIALAGAVFAAINMSLHFKTRALRRRQQEYRSITDQALRTIANTIDAKDKYTNGHSVRVADYSRRLAARLGMDDEEQERIYYIALLHDIGKIGIPDAVLNKPGRLTDEEMKIIRSHPAIGGDILKDFTALPGIEEGARYHHERYDGGGYNEGLKGEEIPLYARIIGVADAYDAMHTNRVYRPPLTEEKIQSELRTNSGKQFDPTVLAAMLDMLAEEKGDM